MAQLYSDERLLHYTAIWASAISIKTTRQGETPERQEKVSKEKKVNKVMMCRRLRGSVVTL